MRSPADDTWPGAERADTPITTAIAVTRPPDVTHDDTPRHIPLVTDGGVRAPDLRTWSAELALTGDCQRAPWMTVLNAVAAQRLQRF